MLTQDQIDKLNKAIELAQEPGACLYEYDGKPCCVIGQLAALEGATPKVLHSWEAGSPTNVAVVLDSYTPAELSKYPSRLLSELQSEWDESSDARADLARRNMRSLVLRYATGQEDT